MPATKKSSVWEEAFKVLGRPWEDSQLKFKIQSMAKDKKSWAQVATYVDARDVERRLNELVSVGILWDNEVEFVPMKEADGRTTWAAKYTLRLFKGDESTQRTDVGLGDDPKAAASDGLKRAAVLFGMDDAYSGPRMFLREGQFTERGRILVSDEELVQVFRGKKDAVGDSGSGGSRGSVQRLSSSGGGNSKPSEKQVNFLKSFLKKVKEQGGNPDDFLASLLDGEKVAVEDLDRRTVSNLLDRLTKEFEELLRDFMSDAPEDEELPPEEDLPF